MNRWKLVVLGGLAFYVVTFVIGLATGPLIHQRALQETYRAHSELWRPELNQVPPDMGALMPRWITTGVIGSLIIAFVYGWVRPAWKGPGWKRGLQGGFVLGLLGIVYGPLGYSGVFNAPDEIWIWWGLEGFLYYLPGGAVLGWLGDKLDPLPA